MGSFLPAWPGFEQLQITLCTEWLELTEAEFGQLTEQLGEDAITSIRRFMAAAPAELDESVRGLHANVSVTSILQEHPRDLIVKLDAPGLFTSNLECVLAMISIVRRHPFNIP